TATTQRKGENTLVEIFPLRKRLVLETNSCRIKNEEIHNYNDSQNDQEVTHRKETTNKEEYPEPDKNQGPANSNLSARLVLRSTHECNRHYRVDDQSNEQGGSQYDDQGDRQVLHE